MQEAVKPDVIINYVLKILKAMLQSVQFQDFFPKGNLCLSFLLMNLITQVGC